jgi:MerR family mercuric resistance operon transcriptional regulator
MTGKTTLLIGALSKRTGCNIETIRYYERIGLLPAPPRTAGGRRLYSYTHLKRLTFIRRSRQLGFHLGEIRELLNLVDGGSYTCDEVRELTVTHAGEVERKIVDLQRMSGVLRKMTSKCSGGKVPDCPIIDALFQDNK